jgi:general secretion pathway protein K
VIRDLWSASATRTERGSSMLLATLAAMLLATGAASMLTETRAARASAGESLRLARADLDAESALAIAIAQLDAGEPLPRQGIVLSTEGGARVLRQDVAGLIDINAAPASRLAELMSALGVGADEAQRLGDRIVDWRDEDDLRSPHGAEKDEYEAAGVAPPGNRAFLTETEVVLVLGMSQALGDCLAPYVTTYSGQEELDADAASPELLQLLNLPRAGIVPTGPPLGGVIILTTEAPISEHAALQRRVWIRLTGDVNAPYMIHRASRAYSSTRSAPPCELGG